MEKNDGTLTSLSSPTRCHSQKGWATRYRAALLVIFALIALKFSSGVLRGCHNLNPTSSTLSSGIAWSSCPDLTEFDCAYLSVPLDYINPLPNETVSLALRRLPATAPMKERLGTLFTNPGGPGGSGTASVVRTGPPLSTIFKGRYDILSWDPRGINMTTPALECYPTDWDEYMQGTKKATLGLPFEARYQGDGPNSTTAELAYFEKVDAYFRATQESCERNGNKKMLSAVSTAFTARDMVSILEALGEEERGMQYWGFSYGTVLGATFSAMFPDLVHRVVLDGVSDAVSFTGDGFEHGRGGMADTNKVWDGFLTACASSGPEGCGLAKEGSTATSISAEIDALVDHLLEKPLAVPFTGMNSGIITASDVLAAIFQGLYSPRGWPHLAQALADAVAGDAAGLADLTAFTDEAAMSRRDPLDNVFGRHMTRLSSEVSGVAVKCSDTNLAIAHSMDTEEFLEYSHEIEKLSITGGRWAQWISACRSWNIKAIEAYRGPWTVEEGLKKTKYPVVFLSNTADPVTPLASGQSMSFGFGNESATLLIQDGFGHCSPAHPSLCTAHALADYFFEGKVPEYGTTCKSDPGYLFPSSSSGSQRMAQLSAEDTELMHAMEQLSEGMMNWW